MVNSPGNRPSHDGTQPWTGRAADLARRGGHKQVLLRRDTGFSLTGGFDGWDKDGRWFVFGMDAHSTLAARAQELDESRWQPLQRPAKPKGLLKQRVRHRDRIVAQRGYRNQKLVCEEVSEAVGHSYKRCNQEKISEQLGNGVPALRLPSGSLLSNWAWMMIASQNWNLKSWLGLTLPEGMGAGRMIRMHFRRFLDSLLRIPCAEVSSRSIDCSAAASGRICLCKDRPGCIEAGLQAEMPAPTRQQRTRESSG